MACVIVPMYRGFKVGHTIIKLFGVPRSLDLKIACHKFQEMLCTPE